MLDLRVPSKPSVKLALCVPSAGTWKADFGMSFASMCVHLGSSLFEPDQDRQVVVLDKRTSMLPRSRQECLEDALLQSCTHALFLDTDQSFPADICHKLMAWKKPVVAANIALKCLPSFPNARQRGATAFGVPVTSDPHKHGLEKVWRVGTGIMLIDMAIMADIPKPWFEVRYDQKEGQYVGEDWCFCECVEKAGHAIYIDHDASRTVGHIGEYVFTHGNIPQIEQLEAA